MATYSAFDVASEIRKRLPGVPVKKLHKLLYYCQAHHVTMLGVPLFTETVSAWDMGPVVGELWWREKQGDVQGEPMPHALTEAELNTVGYVVSRYGNLSGTDLERLTHSEDPWIEADAERQRLNRTSYRISLESLRSFFSREAGDAESAASDESSVPPIEAADLQEWFAAAGGGLSDTLVEDSPAALRARLR